MILIFSSNSVNLRRPVLSNFKQIFCVDSFITFIKLYNILMKTNKASFNHVFFKLKAIRVVNKSTTM